MWQSLHFRKSLSSVKDYDHQSSSCADKKFKIKKNRVYKNWAVANNNSFWTIGFIVSIWERNFKTNLTPLFQFGSGSSKTNSEKWGAARYNSFWTGDDDGMAQKYTDRLRLRKSSTKMLLRLLLLIQLNSYSHVAVVLLVVYHWLSSSFQTHKHTKAELLLKAGLPLKAELTPKAVQKYKDAVPFIAQCIELVTGH